MSMANNLLRAVQKAIGYQAKTVGFGSPNRLDHAGTVGQNSQLLSVSLWVYFNSLTSNPVIIALHGADADESGWLFVNSSGAIELNLKEDGSSSTTPIVQLTSATGVITTGTWHHVAIASFNGSGAVATVWVDDVELTLSTETLTTGVVQTNCDGGCNIGSFSTGSHVDGELSEVFWKTNTYIDFATLATRRQFITSDGKPAGDLLTTTGLTPDVYLNNAYTSFEINKGAAGNFTVSGTLSQGTNGPVQL